MTPPKSRFVDAVTNALRANLEISSKEGWESAACTLIQDDSDWQKFLSVLT